MSAMPIKTLRARPASGKLFSCRLREGAGGRFNSKGNASAEFAVEGSGSFDVDELFVSCYPPVHGGDEDRFSSFAVMGSTPRNFLTTWQKTKAAQKQVTHVCEVGEHAGDPSYCS